MTMKRNIVRMLDRPGGRYLLGKIATVLAKKKIGPDVDVFYDSLWMHRVGPYYFPDGRHFDYYTSTFHRWKSQSNRYLSNAIDFWFQHGRPKIGEVVIDIGAGRGEDTLAFSQAVGRNGRVIAIEAHPLSFEILSEFCHRNDLSNTTLLHLAVMDKPGTVEMVESEHWFGAHVENSTEGSQPIKVRSVTLQEIFEAEAIDEVALLKMNIEGAERYALPGMEGIMDRIHTICVACHDFRADRGDGEQFRTREYVEQFLAGHGFKVASRPDDPRVFVRDHIFGLRAT